MRFTLALLSAKGKVAERRTYDGDRFRAARFERRLVRKFKELLRDSLETGPLGGRNAQCTLDESRRITLDLSLPWSFCALAGVRIAEEPGFFFAYLPGYYPEMEGAPITIVGQVLEAMAGKPVPVQLLPERPLVLCLGCPLERELRATFDAVDILRWGLTLAVAYFEWAAERHAAMPEKLQDKHAGPEGNGNPPASRGRPD